MFIPFALFILLPFGNAQLLRLLEEFGNLLNVNLYNSERDPEYLQQYDFIVIGAGSGGSVVANRLSENPKWKVLLLEAGREENFVSDIPILAAFQTSTSYNWGYKSEKSSAACLGK